MRSKFKRFVIYTLIAMIMLPVSILTGTFSAKTASASVPPKVFGKTDVTKVPASGVWNNGTLNGLFTSGSHSGSYLEADALQPGVDDSGFYKIETNWVVWDNHPTNTFYQINQGANSTPVGPVNQKLMADGSSAANGADSGFYTLTNDYYFSGVSDVYLRISGENADNGNVSFISFKVTFVAPGPVAKPATPVLISPSSNSYTNNDKPLFDWNPVADLDGDSDIAYELFVYQLGVASPVIHKTGLSNSQYQSINQLDEGYYNWYVIATDDGIDSEPSVTNKFTLVTEEPDAPMNLTDVVSGPNVSLSWDLALDDLGDAVAGYNIYRSASPAVKINPSLVTSNSYIDNPGNGTFGYNVTAVDKAGNESGMSNLVHATVAYTAIPVVVATAGDGKNINVSFSGVDSGVTEYDIYINGILARQIPVSGNDYGIPYAFSIPVSDFGSYSVMVRAIAGGLSYDSTLSSVTLSAPAVKTSATVYHVSTVAVAEAAAPAATTPAVTTPAVESTQPTEQGEIKGETENSATTESINWTPWIILFILILLAGAATGGYFYWFGGDDDRDEKKSEIKPVRGKNGSAKTNGGKAAAKKPRRW